MKVSPVLQQHKFFVSSSWIVLFVFGVAIVGTVNIFASQPILVSVAAFMPISQTSRASSFVLSVSTSPKWKDRNSRFDDDNDDDDGNDYNHDKNHYDHNDDDSWGYTPKQRSNDNGNRDNNRSNRSTNSRNDRNKHFDDYDDDNDYNQDDGNDSWGFSSRQQTGDNSNNSYRRHDRRNNNRQDQGGTRYGRGNDKIRVRRDESKGNIKYHDDFGVKIENTKEVQTDDNNKSHFFSKKPLNHTTFRHSELFEPLCEAAAITRPSRIQSMAWPAILTGKHTIVADQTGSGKTLAYLIPLLQRALENKETESKTNGAPKVLVLAPTAELADQIRDVCGKISEKVPFKTLVVTANGKYTTSIRDQIRLIQRQPVDVLISTPGRISTVLRTRNSGLDLSSLQTIVLDEVDMLLVDQTFGPQLRTVGAAAPLERTQFVFVTATLPNNIVKKVEKEFPGVVQVKGPGLHRVAPTVKERLIDVSVPSKYNRDAKMCFDIKAKQLLSALRHNRCRRTLVFCNTVESCRQVENLLTRKDRKQQIHEVSAYHNAMSPEARQASLKIFAQGRKEQKTSESSSRRGRHQRQEVDYVLVCTDRAARGVDFHGAPVDHVVIFDFPKNPAEYVRRVGRTARAGRAGATTVFAYGWQLPIARSVMGNKLDSFTVAADAFAEAKNEVDDPTANDNKHHQYKDFPVGSRKKGKKNGYWHIRDELIRGNIEDGTLWDE